MIELRAGPWRALLDRAELRDIRWGNSVVIHHLYCALRSADWATPQPALRRTVVEQGAACLEVEVEAEVVDGELDLCWTGRYRLREDGSLGFSVTALARRAFEVNRLGICVLHPWRALAGSSFRGHGPSGHFEGSFELDVQPQLVVDGVPLALHPPVDRLEVLHRDGGRAAFRFEGDLFETEDQRNWSDASFKTYSTPLAAPRPRRLAAGETLSQRIECKVSGVPERAAPPETVTLHVGEETGSVLPGVGTTLPSSGSPPFEALATLRLLAPAHLRLDVRAGPAGWLDAVRAAAANCSELAAGLELALHLGADDVGSLGGLAQLEDLPLARLLIAAAGAAASETTPGELVAAARAHLPAGVPLAAGSILGFSQLNRSRLAVEGIDGLFWPVHPQSHVVDDRSLLETPEVQAEQVRTARSFAPGRELYVGPITLLPRLFLGQRDLVAGEAEDPRQRTLLGAAFTLASLKYLAESGASALTYFECTGGRGLAALEEPGEGTAATGSSRRGTAFPLLHPLADVAARRGRAVRRCDSDDASAVVGLAVSGGPSACDVLVANLTPGRRRVRILGARPLAARRLVAASASLAGEDPAAFRAMSGEPLAGSALSLEAYETALVACADYSGGQEAPGR